ncbi:MAG: RHS repeat protein, partial [Chloroflexaceae bacterium]|nr:RHS repeat protein [Chloroflexaceae bacterium]
MYFAAASTGSDHDGFIYLLEFPRAALLDDQTRAPEDQCSAQPNVGGPINTRSGNLWHRTTDLVLHAPVQPLEWSRIYHSQSISDTDTVPMLGRGWHSLLESRLEVDEAKGEVVVLSAQGNRLRFQKAPDGTYDAPPGVSSVLKRSGKEHLHILCDGTIHLFDRHGRLRKIQSPQGGAVKLEYDPPYLADNSPEGASRLVKVFDALHPDQWFFTIQYGEEDHAPAITVTDSLSRQVIYGYDAQQNLTSVTDPMGRTTQYTYTDHLLTDITSPTGEVVEHNDYEPLPNGTSRVNSQTLQDGRTLQLSYVSEVPPGQTTEPLSKTVITTSDRQGNRQSIETILYDAHGAMYGRIIEDATTSARTVEAIQHGGMFVPQVITDTRGMVTHITSNPLGLPLTVTNALNQNTSFDYTSDGRFPTHIAAADGTSTSFTYANGTLKRIERHAAPPDGDGNLLPRTTLFTYTHCGHDLYLPLILRQGTGPFSPFATSAAPFPRTDGRPRTTPLCLLYETQTPDGVVTRFDHNDLGQVVTMTVGVGTTTAQTTTYAYDQAGRVVTTTLGLGTASERQDVVRYHDDDTPSRTILNYQDGERDPTDAPDADVITDYGYDSAGRLIWIRDAAGSYHARGYNEQGLVAWTVRNLVSETGGNGQLPFKTDEINGQIILHQDDPLDLFDPASPDQNVATHYDYDGLGRVTRITETGLLTGTFNLTGTSERKQPYFATSLTRTTRIDYDYRNRPVAVTLNVCEGCVEQPDANVQVLTRYDQAGNLIAQRDGLHRWTVIGYDALSRPITITQNYENGDPLTIDPEHEAWATLDDTDRITVLTYGANGQVAQLIENDGDGEFDPQDPDHDRVTRITYDGLGRPHETTRNPVPETQAPDVNLRSQVHYDPDTGRMTRWSSEKADAATSSAERWTQVVYDPLGRQTGLILNSDTSHGTDNAFDPEAPDRNVGTHWEYDALNRLTSETDTLGIVTRFTYDALGRVQTHTRNDTGVGTFSDEAPDANVTTTYAYDRLGRTTVVTEVLAEGQEATTRFTYDGLGRTTAMTDPMGRVTRYGYDGLGTLRWVQHPSGPWTVYQVDGLGRVTATILNYQDGLVTAEDADDQDVVARTDYDAAGRVVAIVEADGSALSQTRTTTYAYDLLDRLVQVVENAWDEQEGACPQAPCNVTTTYTYDRADHLIAVTDGKGQVWRFAYDAADRPRMARDPLGRETGWSYDALGHSITMTDSRQVEVRYAYDGLDRLTEVSSPQLEESISQTYDGLGRRTTLTDATGTTRFAYDHLSRLREVDAPNGPVRYASNAQGQRTQIGVLQGTTWITATSTYSSDGRLHQVHLAGDPYPLVRYAYDPAGRVLTETRSFASSVYREPTTLETSYAYDGADRLTRRATTLNEAPFGQFEYQVNRLGLRTLVTETLPIRQLPTPTPPSRHTPLLPP